MHIPSDIGGFTTRRGVELFTRRFVPSDPRALLIVAHGFGDHSGRYSFFVDYFTRHGFAVCSFDQEGQGASGGMRGDVIDFRLWVDAFADFVGHAGGLFEQRLPIFAVGHSVGGLVVLSYAAACGARVCGAVISAPALRLIMPLWKRLFAYPLGRAVPRLYLPTDIVPASLSRIPSIVTAYRDDPLVVKHLTARAGLALLQFAARTRRCARDITLPLFMFHETGDMIAAASATQEFFEQVQETHKCLKIYGGEFHEPFNDTIHDDVFADMHGWFERMIVSEQ